MNYRPLFYNNPSPKKSFAQLSRSKLSFRSLSKNKMTQIDKTTNRNAIHAGQNQDYYVLNSGNRNNLKMQQKRPFYQINTKNKENLYTYRSNINFPNQNKLTTEYFHTSIIGKSPQRTKLITCLNISKDKSIIKTPPKNSKTNRQNSSNFLRSYSKQQISFKNKQNKECLKGQNQTCQRSNQYGITNILKKSYLKQQKTSCRIEKLQNRSAFEVLYIDKQNQKQNEGDFVNSSMAINSILDMQPFL